MYRDSLLWNYYTWRICAYYVFKSHASNILLGPAATAHSIIGGAGGVFIRRSYSTVNLILCNSNGPRFNRIRWILFLLLQVHKKGERERETNQGVSVSTTFGHFRSDLSSQARLAWRNFVTSFTVIEEYSRRTLQNWIIFFLSWKMFRVSIRITVTCDLIGISFASSHQQR